MKYTEREKDIIQTFYCEHGAKGTKEILERCGFNRLIKGICHYGSVIAALAAGEPLFAMD